MFDEDFAALYARLAAECADGKVNTRVFFWERKGIWEQVAARRVAWLEDRPAVLLSITNITEVCRSEYEYKQMAYYDQLLHLPNEQKLKEDIATLDSFDHAALIHFDIDRFASINELYGWDAGDALLTQIRDWLLATLRKTSRLYRVNDDEFCLFIRNISLAECKARAGEILRRFEQPWMLRIPGGETAVYCSVEMGVVYGTPDRGDIRNILYRTTHAPGRVEAGYVLYDETTDARLQERVRLRGDLINCVKDGMRGFRVYFQPIADAKTGQWVGAEALCRWTTPQGEAVPPSVFIPEAERLGLVSTMDEWVRETVLAQCMAWGLHQKYFFLDMNLSPLQPLTSSFISGFLATLDRLAYPRDKLTLEITESAKMDFSKENMAGLHRLRDAGITLALDDFGTGHSTFETLARIPARVLKTERLFIQTLEQDGYYQYLMRLLVDIAHTVGMKLIAEGVENERQQALLREYGADYIQGYLFAQPLPPESFALQLHRFGAGYRPTAPCR